MSARVGGVTRAAAWVALLAVAACTRAAPPAPVAMPASGKRAESTRGMVVASQEQATRAGLEILDAGGNAVDAAVATAFALGVVDPSQTGLGGGGAMTVWRSAARRADHLLFYPRAGADDAWAKVDSSPRSLENAGIAAAIPGQTAGLLEAHARFGVLPRERVLAPAIRLAREGFIVSPLLARTIASSREKLAFDPRVAERFLPNGEPLRPGERLVQPELAALLELIAVTGADAFYRSAYASILAMRVQNRGGRITEDDLGAYAPVWTRPLCARWQDYTVLGAPPPMGGTVVLELLQLLERGGATTAGGYTDVPQTAVTFVDAHRIATADAQRWRGDPAVRAVPARGVSSARYAADRAALLRAPVLDTVTAGVPWAADSLADAPACAAIEPFPMASVGRNGRAGGAFEARAGEATGADTSFTSHLSVVDAEGNAVAMTTTVGVLFGSGVWADGVFLNSAANNFDGATRGTSRFSNSTIAPTIVLDDDRVRLVVGAAGSQYIQSAVAQVTLRMLAFGEDPGIALSAPRLQGNARSRVVEVEPGFAPEVYAALVARGYQPWSRVGDILFGGVHAILVTEDGRRIGAADPRRDGTAAGQASR